LGDFVTDQDLISHVSIANRKRHCGIGYARRIGELDVFDRGRQPPGVRTVQVAESQPDAGMDIRMVRQVLLARRVRAGDLHAAGRMHIAEVRARNVCLCEPILADRASTVGDD
jgi:hypothetical protein